MKTRISNHSARCSQGFTLTKIIVVGGSIIGILAILLTPRIGGSSYSRPTAAYADIKGGIKSAIGQYKADNRSYPQSLQDLIVQPANAKNWHGPYFDPPNVPVDPWGNSYVYYYPGKHNPASYDLLSKGPDGQEGTADDIGNWMQ